MADTISDTPDEHTLFRIGSITKLFTSLQTLILRDTSKLASLDDDIKTYYPDFYIQNPFSTNGVVTFRHLMNHMSGLPRDIPCMDIFEKGGSLSDTEILYNLAEISLKYPPRTLPTYSNLGFGLLGMVIMKIAKASSWNELLTKMVLHKQDMSYGYYPDGSVADFKDIGWDSSASQSYSSSADLVKLMSLVFNNEQSSKVQVTFLIWLKICKSFIF